TAELAAAAVRECRAGGGRAAVVPCRSIVQALAALAVHDPDAAWEDALTAMTAAAVGTRYAEIPAQGTDAIGAAVGAARSLLDGTEGALVTLVHGPGTPVGLVEAVVDAVAEAAPGIETAVYAGAPVDLALAVGVE
ncbi:MAG TPA: hypothetical protein VF053_12600, partial [Streptosporangiales bacterium]